MPPSIAEVERYVKNAVNEQQREIDRLQANVHSLNDFDPQIVQAKNLLASFDYQIMRTLVTWDQKSATLEAFAIVDKGGGKMLSIEEWQVQVVSVNAQAGSQMLKCDIGAFLPFGQVVSINGSELLTAQERLLAADFHHEREKQKRLAKEQEHIENARLTAQRQQEEALLINRIAEHERVQAEKQKAETEKQKAETEKRKTDDEHRRLEAERQRLKSERHEEQIKLEAIRSLQTATISLEQARHYLSELKSSGTSNGQNRDLIIERVKVLGIKFKKSQSVASSGSNDNVGIGAIAGGILGLLGGPLGAVFGAVLGGAIGGLNSETSEKDKWDMLIRELDSFLANLSNV